MQRQVDARVMVGNFKKVSCNNEGCDFWHCGECLYGGTAEITPDLVREGQCAAYEPFRDEGD